ncbi:MAG: hypothetical protein AAGA56_10285, partial [Myxococcota bacterium]
PPAFIDALVGAGTNVLNLDRRGAGNSSGDGQQAFTGPNGKFDAKAGFDFLVRHGCAIDPERVAYVGASNGTTTALDIAVFSETSEAVPAPGALVFLTGGTYTENQNTVASARPYLDQIPLQFVFSTAERTWSAQFDENAALPWALMEYENGAHGTSMFDAAPASVDDVVAFLTANL